MSNIGLSVFGKKSITFAVALSFNASLMPLFAEVLLPLALSDTLTYRVPPTLASQVAVGKRVVVEVGKRKCYTGIVAALHSDAGRLPTEKLKDIVSVEDSTPLVSAAQLTFWRWVADYYMCTPGEVMKAALPSGLKLESETYLAVVDDAEVPDDLSDIGRAILVHLAKRPDTLHNIEKAVGNRGVFATAKRMIDEGLLQVAENLTRTFQRRTKRGVRLTEDWFDESRLTTLLDELHKRSPRSEEMLLSYLDMAQVSAALTLQNFKMVGEVTRQDLLTRCGSPSALKTLRQRGVIEEYDIVLSRLPSTTVSDTIGIRPLSEEQQRAAAQIRDIWAGTNEVARRVCLLHGVTASGKTEVYTHLIADTLRQGKQVLYLLPEIALTTQIMERLGRIFGNRMGVYHSKFSDAMRSELWLRQASTNPFPLILGVRSALFLPFRDLGLIIVDEEHETSYKQQDPAPRYHARDAAIVLARQHHANVLLGTATPSIETYHHAQVGKYGLVELHTRYGGVKLPQIVVEDIKELKRKKLMTTPYSPRLIEEIRSALSRKEQVIVFQNRRGYAPVLTCRSCGWTPRCTACDVTLTYHQQSDRLVCHYCGTSYPRPHACPQCGDSELRDVGFGTEKVEEHTHRLFPEARIARMDLDTTRGASSYAQIIDDFQQGRTDILIGTQMVTKGLDFDRVSVVGILNADQGLSVPNFRATERTFQMMAQVAGRAGRRDRQGTVILQTHQPDATWIGQVMRGDYSAFFGSQMAERRRFVYPPQVRIIDIYLKHHDDRYVEEAAQVLAQWLRPHFGDRLQGPDKPAVARIQRLYIRKLMLKVNTDFSVRSVRDTLRTAAQTLLAQPTFKRITLYFDVDPM